MCGPFFRFHIEGNEVMAETLEAPVDEQITQETPTAVETPAVETDAVENSGVVDGGAVENSGIDEGLVATAKSYGLNPEHWPNGESLQRAVTQFDMIRAHQLQQSAMQYQQPQGKPETQAQTQARQKLDFDKLLPKEQFDENLVSALKSIYEDLHGELEAKDKKLTEFEPLREKVSQFEQYMQQQAAVQYESQMDGFFNGLGKEWEDVFGKGELRQLPPRSVQVANRLKLDQALGQIQQIDAMQGQRGSLTSQQQRALHLAFGDQLPTIERRKLAIQGHERKNGALARPASKQGKPLDPEAASIASIGQWIAKHAG
jgi:hypothetical protein